MIFFIGVIAFVLGIFIGWIFKSAACKSDGMFIINDEPEERTQWILDVTCNPDDIPKKKRIILNVKIYHGEVGSE